MCDSRLPKQLLSEVRDCMENNVRTSARFGRRRNVSKPASKIPSRTWTSTPVLKSRLLRTVQLGLAKSPLGLLRQKTDGTQYHRGNVPLAKPEQPPLPLQHPCTLISYARASPLARIGLTTSIFGPIVASPQSEVVVIFDFFRRTNNNVLNKY